LRSPKDRKYPHQRGYMAEHSHSIENISNIAKLKLTKSKKEKTSSQKTVLSKRENP
jgi:hypothetical protein